MVIKPKGNKIDTIYDKRTVKCVFLCDLSFQVFSIIIILLHLKLIIKMYWYCHDSLVLWYIAQVFREWEVYISDLNKNIIFRKLIFIMYTIYILA